MVGRTSCDGLAILDPVSFPDLGQCRMTHRFEQDEPVTALVQRLPQKFRSHPPDGASGRVT